MKRGATGDGSQKGQLYPIGGGRLAINPAQLTVVAKHAMPEEHLTVYAHVWIWRDPTYLHRHSQLSELQLPTPMAYTQCETL